MWSRLGLYQSLDDVRMQCACLSCWRALSQPEISKTWRFWCTTLQDWTERMGATKSFRYKEGAGLVFFGLNNRDGCLASLAGLMLKGNICQCFFSKLRVKVLCYCWWFLFAFEAPRSGLLKLFAWWSRNLYQDTAVVWSIPTKGSSKFLLTSKKSDRAISLALWT